MTVARSSVVCLTTYFPWPADSGGCIRVDGFLRSLSNEFDVTLLVPREHDTATTARLVAEVARDTGIRVEVFDEPRRRRSRAAAAGLWIRCLRQRIPPWIYCELDAEMMTRFTQLASEVDAVVLLQDFMGLYPLLAPGPLPVPVIADKHVVLARPRTEHENTARVRALRRLTTSYERRYLARAARVVVTTDEDGRWLKQLYDRTPTAIIPTGVEVAPPRVSRSSARRRIGWLSALDVEDNRWGLEWFLAEGWSSLQNEGCELFVAGRKPAADVREMTDLPGVHLLGHVDSLDSFFDDIDVAVIPLWSGRGIKVKTLTLMGAGIPVAATPMAVEGMVVEDGKHCLIGQTPQELAGHVRRLLDDRAYADAVAAAGRALIAEQFTWDAVGPRFNAVVHEALTNAV